MYLPANSTPRGKYPTHPQIFLAISSSLFTFLEPTILMKISKASSGENTLRAIFLISISKLCNLVVIKTPKRLLFGKYALQFSLLLTSSNITKTKPWEGCQFCQHQATCCSIFSRFP